MIQQAHDALPAIDKEYDHPLVKGLVHQLIAEEMKDQLHYFTSMEHDTTVPDDIDDFLSQRYPHLWNNQRIQQSMQKIESSNKLVNEGRLRESVEYQQVTPPPSANVQHDAKAWKRVVDDNLIKYMHLDNHILNLQVAEECARKDSYVGYNQSLEQMAKHYQERQQTLNKEIHELQQQRLRTQERFYPQLTKYDIKAKEAIIRTIQCDQATEELIQYLQARGFSYEDYVREEAERAEVEALRQANDPRANNTVREYEAVTVEDADEDDEEEEHPSKKSRQI